MKKYSLPALLASMILLVAVNAGCTKEEEPTPAASAPSSQQELLKLDAVTTEPGESKEEASAEPKITPSAAQPAAQPVAQSATQTTITTPPAATTPAPTPAPAVKTISMTAKMWDFSPSTITVNKGDAVKLSIKSIDVDHGFFLPDFGVNTFLKPGMTTSASFTADKTGTFSFSCNVSCGSGHGSMRGTLIVK